MPNVASSLAKCNKWVWRSATPRCCTSCSKASGGEGYKSGNKGSAGQNREISEEKVGKKTIAADTKIPENTKPVTDPANLGKAFLRCTVLAAPCNSQTRMAQLFPLPTRISCKRKTRFSPLLKFAFALCTTCNHFDLAFSTLCT